MTSELAGMKFSESPRSQESVKTNVKNIERINNAPRRSLDL